MRPLPVIMAEMTPQLGPLEARSPATLVLEESPQLETVGLIYLVLIVAGAALNIYFIFWIQHTRPWREGVSRLLWRPWSWLHLGQVMGVILGVHLALYFLIFMYGLFTGVDLLRDHGRAPFIPGLAFHVAGLLGLIMLMKRRRVNWQSGFGVTAEGLGHKVVLGGACYLAALPFIALSAYLYDGLLIWLGQEVDHQVIFDDLARLESPWTLILITAFAIIIAPVFEELIFRGLGLPLLVKRFGLPAGVLLISLLFGLMHFHIPSLVPLFVFAVALALAYIYTQSMVTPVVMHALFNGVNLLFFTVLKT